MTYLKRNCQASCQNILRPLHELNSIQLAICSYAQYVYKGLFNVMFESEKVTLSTIAMLKF